MSKTEAEAPKAEFTKYLIAIDTNARHVEILLDGHKPSPGHREVGEFEANAVTGEVKGEEDFETNGDHILIAKAKTILEDLEIQDFQNMVYEDKASNAPAGDNYVMTHKDREDALRDGVSPTDRQAEISENLDEAEAEAERSTKRKSGTKKKKEKEKDDPDTSTKK